MLALAATMAAPPRCSTHRPLSSSFLGLPYRILNINRKKELLRGLWVEFRAWGSRNDMLRWRNPGCLVVRDGVWRLLLLTL